MGYLVTASEMREYDRNTIERIGIPGMVLMERAALESFRILQELGKVRKGASAFIFAGYGNNGGDGLALARLLSESGVCVEVGLVGKPEKATESWKLQRKILGSYPVSVNPFPAGKEPSRNAYDILVDALFGVGLSRNLEGEYALAVDTLNRMEGFKLALDLPSGVCGDDGYILGTAFRADLTVTFGFGKRGLFLYPGCENAGEVRTVDIGIGPGAFDGREPGMYYLEEAIPELLPRRDKAGNKGSFGKALLIAGSSGMAGAAILCGEACYRTGAGMVKILTDPDNRVILQERLPEALFGVYTDIEGSLPWCDGICIGPGLGKSGEARKILEYVIRANSDIPLLIDADGINLLTETPVLLEELAGQGAGGREILLTPHLMEFSRLYSALFGRENTPDLQEIRRGASEYGMQVSEKLCAVVAVKDARTFVCKKGRPVCLNIAGNSGMATAGSGDVLAGILIGRIVQGERAYDAACRGVRLHALAGDLAAEKLGEHGMLAGDIYRQI